MRSLQDAGFILYTDASEDNFVDVVNNDHEVYTPQLLYEEEEFRSEDGSRPPPVASTYPAPAATVSTPHHGEEDETHNLSKSLTPTVRCLRDILDDESYDKYSIYSDVNIHLTASLGPSDVGHFTMDQASSPPPSEPPPSI